MTVVEVAQIPVKTDPPAAPPCTAPPQRLAHGMVFRRYGHQAQGYAAGLTSSSHLNVAPVTDMLEYAGVAGRQRTLRLCAAVNRSLGTLQ